MTRSNRKMSKKIWAGVAAAAMIAAGCGAGDSSDDADAALADAIGQLTDEIDSLNQQIDDLEAERDDTPDASSDSESSSGESSDDSSSSGSSSDSSSSGESSSDSASDSSSSGSSSSDSSSSDSSSSGSSSSDSSSGDTSGSAELRSSYIPEPEIDEMGTVADQAVAEEIAEELGCEGSHEMDGRYMPCADHGEGAPLVEEYFEELTEPYPEGAVYDTVEEAERAAEEAACEGTHEMDGMHMPCEVHGEYEENMEMIDEVGPLQVTEDGIYDTEAEALAAAAAAGCTGTHQMGDQWMMCSEHAEGEATADEYADAMTAEPMEDDAEDDAVDDGTLTTISDPLAEIELVSKKSLQRNVRASYDGRYLDSSEMYVCIEKYNKRGASVGCSPGTQGTYVDARYNWTVKCQRPINGNPKRYFSIVMMKSNGAELARIDVSLDSDYKC